METIVECLYNCTVLPLPGKPCEPGILLFTFSGVENHWNVFKKWENPGILTQNQEFGVSRFTFQDVIYKKTLIYIYVIATLSTQTLIQSQINMRFHCYYLEITWKIHGILSHQKNGNPEL